MASGIALGAFGAHGLRNKLSKDQLEIYKTGVFYHLIHAIGLFIVAWLMTGSLDFRLNAAGILFSVGIFLFSGSLYLIAIKNIKWMGMLTPLGGLAFIAGWLLILVSYVG